MNPNLLEQAIQSIDVQKAYDKEQTLATAWDVVGTPTYFIGIPNRQPVKLVGYQSKEKLIQVINQQLGK